MSPSPTPHPEGSPLPLNAHGEGGREGYQPRLAQVGDATPRKKGKFGAPPPARLQGAQVLDLSEVEVYHQTSADKAAKRRVGRPRAWTDPEQFYATGLAYFDERDACLESIMLPSGKIVVKKGKPYTIAGLASSLSISIVTLAQYERDPNFAEAVRMLKSVVLDNAIERSYGMYSAGPIAQARFLGMVEPKAEDPNADQRPNVIEIHLPAKQEIIVEKADEEKQISDATGYHSQVQKITEAPLTAEEMGLTPPSQNGHHKNGRH